LKAIEFSWNEGILKLVEESIPLSSSRKRFGEVSGVGRIGRLDVASSLDNLSVCGEDDIGVDIDSDGLSLQFSGQ
jgi:hypothetical protein